jgi:hypothetical protein
MCTGADIYTAIQTTASKLYKKHRDGLKYEQMINGMMTELAVKNFADIPLAPDQLWSSDFANGGSMYTSFTCKILLLPESIINGFGHQKIIDKNHFMMQIFRIPLKESCTLGNLLRIACYTGILSACMKSDDFPEGIVRTFKALNMYSVDCYVNTDRYTEAVKDITKEDIDRILTGLLCRNDHLTV